jgi:hypothetical protein
MKYIIIMERFKPEYKICKYDPKEDGIEAIENLKYLTKTFEKEIKEEILKVYLIVE